MNLYYKAYIASNPEKIWSILTKPEISSKVYYGASVHSDWTVGSAIRYIGPGRDGENTLHIQGEVLAFDPLKKLSHTTLVGNAYQADVKAYASVVTYELEDAGFATCLTIRHEDWQPEDPSYANTKENWWLLLSNIKTLAETGSPLNIGLHE